MRFYLIAFGLSCALFARAVDCVWTQNTPNTPDTAYAWEESSNWKDGLVPSATDTATLTGAQTGTCFVRLPEVGVSLYGIETSQNIILLGGELVIVGQDKPGKSYAKLRGRLFAPLRVLAGGGQYPYFSGNFAAPITLNEMNLAISGTFNYHMDWFAQTAGPTRTGDFLLTDPYVLGPGSSPLYFWAPRGAEEQKSTWSGRAGSPYLTRASETNQPLAGGTFVTGTGIPEGTFLKRILTDSIIELSAPLTADAVATELTFAPLTPQMEQHVSFQRISADNQRLAFFKFRPQDGARLVFDRFQPINSTLGLEESERTQGYYPGTCVIKRWEGYHGYCVLLKHAELEFDNQISTIPTSFSFSPTTPHATVGVTITNGNTCTWSCLTNWTGTLVKKGTGTFCVSAGDLAPTSVLRVEAGRMELIRRAASEVMGTLGTLEVKAGATFVVPEEGLSVHKAVFEEGAHLIGTGTLTITGTCERPTTFAPEGDVTIQFRFSNPISFARSISSEVVGHPAFWVDASRPDTITCVEQADGSQGVARWNDCRTGETMFCTNLVAFPTFVQGDTPIQNYVFLDHVQTNRYDGTQALVWSVPVADIRAVFLVQNPSQGGGNILGASPRLTAHPTDYFGSQGGPYYRSSAASPSSPLINLNYSTPCVAKGRFFLNGQEINGTTTGYLGPFLQVIEHHVNTTEKAGTLHHELWCDAFGTGYQDNKPYLANENGAMRIAEYIIYTNSLSHAERQSVANYLSNKWLGKDIVCSEVDTSDYLGDTSLAGEDVWVSPGTAAVWTQINPGSSFTKTGGGTLIAQSAKAQQVSVTEGTLIFKSLAHDACTLAPEAWIHMAADVSQTVECTEANEVERWLDVRGTGDYYAPATSAKALLVTNAVNGRPVLDLGPFTSNSSGKSLRLHKPDGSTYDHANSLTDYISTPHLKQAFLVFGSKNGGGSLLGGYSDGYPYQGLVYCPDAGQQDCPMFYATTTYNGLKNELTAFAKNPTCARLNGNTFNPFETPFSSGYDLLNYTFLTSRKSDHLANCSQGYGRMGGLEYAEVILFSNDLLPARSLAIEAYLQKKWFNRETDHYYSAQAQTLLVKQGASVIVDEGTDMRGQGQGLLTVNTLGGEGTLEGSVDWTGPATFRAEVKADGTIGTLQVSGNVTASSGGTLEWSGACDQLKPGNYTLLSATQFQSAGPWAAPAPNPSRRVRLEISPTGLTAHVSLTGSLLIFR